MFGNMFEDEEEEVSVDSSSTKPSQTSTVPASRKKRLADFKHPSNYKPRANCGYVGLLNQGATCYLNSLLQCIYMTPELRKELFQLSAEELGLDEMIRVDELNRVREEKIKAKAKKKKSSKPAIKRPPTPGPPSSPVDDSVDKENIPPPQVVTPVPQPAPVQLPEWTAQQEENINTLLVMGFERPIVEYAVRKYPRYNFDQYCDFLVSNPTVPEEPPQQTTILAPQPRVELPPRPILPDEEEPNELCGLFDTEMDGQEGYQIEAEKLYDDDERDIHDAFGGPGLLPIPQHETKTNAEQSHETAPTSSNQAEDTNQTEDDDEDDEPEGEFIHHSSHTVEPPVKPTKKIRRMIIELQRLLAWLQGIDQQAISTNRLTKTFGWQGSQVYQQHDVHELNRILFEKIEQSLVETKAQDIMNTLYRGSTVDKLICLSCGKVRERLEHFQDVTLMVKGMTCLEESFKCYTTFETLTGENRYHCESCNAKVDAAKGIIFREFPPILICSLARFEYDWQEDKRKKVGSRFTFPLLLDLQPYSEAAQGSNTQSTTPAVIPQPQEDSDDESQTNQTNNGTQPSTENKKKKRDFKVAQPPVNYKSPLLYELFAVIIHSGGAYGGHYHAYIRDPTKKGEQLNKRYTVQDANLKEILTQAGLDEGAWYDFNDNTVSEIPPESISKQYSGSSESAYMLIYRARSLNQQVDKCIPEIPPHLIEEIIRENDDMVKQRQVYEDIVNELDLYITFPVDYNVDPVTNAILVKQPAPQPSPEPAQNTTNNQPTDAKPEPPKTEPPRPAAKVIHSRQITVDKRKPISTLREKVLQLCAEQGIQPALLKMTELVERTGTLRVYRSIDLVDETSLDTVAIESLDLRENAVLLFWNSVDINSIPWDGTGQKITVKIKFRQQDSTETFPLTVSESDTLLKLRNTLAAITGIQPAEQHLCRIARHQSLVLKPPQDNKTLYELDILNDTLLTIENVSGVGQGKNAQSALVKEAMEHNTIQVYITNMCFSSTDIVAQNSYEVEIDPDVTLRELKQKIIELLHDTDDTIKENEVRLAHFFNGHVGEPFLDESQFIKDAGIHDGNRICIEWGRPIEEENQIHIRFLVVIDGRPVSSEAHEITISKLSTVLDCKTHMAALVFKVPDQYRLRRVDYMESPDTLIDDEDATLEQAGVKHDDLLWLEEGKPPLKGQIKLSFQLYNPIEFTLPSDSQSTIIGYPPSSPGVHLSPAFRRDPSNDPFFLTLLFDLDVSCFWTLEDIKTMLVTQPILNKQVSSPHLIRLWQGDRLLRKDSQTLKRLGISQDTMLTVQIANPEAESQVTDSAILLYVQRRYSASKQFGKPIETYFDGTYVHELRTMLAPIANIPVEKLIIVKYNRYHRTWQVLEDVPSAIKAETKPSEAKPNTPTDAAGNNTGAPTEQSQAPTEGAEAPSATSSKSKKQKKKAESSPNEPATVRGKPYILKDGDVIACKSTEEDPSNLDDLNYVVTAKTSYMIGQQNHPKNKGGNKDKDSSGSSKKSKARYNTEAVLSINLDFE